jgi:prolyl-tRNA synthetase
MSQKKENAISPTRQEDYAEWYQQVVKAADLAENAPVRGCMVIKPWGYAIWENIQKDLDRRIKETGHQNAYFPLFIPLSFLEKESAHVEGFAKECAVITHHRLEVKEGKLIPSGPLEEPLIVRPTSETIIGTSFSQWIHSYRDLPLLINQWANVVRWEMRPRVFLRTAEFLWQEGHTAHATPEEAQEETLKMLEVYRDFSETMLALPLIVGTKSPGERFPGAVETYTIEAMMQDKKALQMGTAHNLGQNFSKAFDIKFSTRSGELDYAYTTSWGVTTRLIGGLIMVHSDDDGLRLPPRIAPNHLVIIPVVNQNADQETLLQACRELKAKLENTLYHRSNLSVHLDQRDLRAGEKGWQWIKKGVPLRVEIGPKDLANGVVTLYRRDQGPKERIQLTPEELCLQVAAILDQIQSNYFNQAKEYRDHSIQTEIKDWKGFQEFFEGEKTKGFVKAHWCGSSACEEAVHPLKVSIRCLPLTDNHPGAPEGHCVICGCCASSTAIFGKSY